MKYRPLGATGLNISEIGFGAWAIGGPVDLFGIPVGWGPVDDRDSETAILRAFDLGVNFFDTADVYGSGHSEELLGRCLHKKDCLIASKVGNARSETRAIKDFSEKHIRASLEKSLIRLQRDHLDLYQLHNPPSEVWRADEVFDLLRTLKAEGRIRISGVSISTMEEGLHLVRSKKVDTIQVLFNILNQEPAKELFPLAEQNGIGIIVRVPLASGLLTGKYRRGHQFSVDDNRRNYLTDRRMPDVHSRIERLSDVISNSGYTMTQISLAFVLGYTAVSTAIPGARNPEQVEQNLSASRVDLNETLRRRITHEFGNYNFFIRHKVHI